MGVVAVALSVALVRFDVWMEGGDRLGPGWLYLVDAEGARTILSVIASSMIGVAGITFSITMLTLQLASTQFGPRTMRNFMRDRGNQLVLGTFTSTFLYCMLVLRAVQEGEDGLTPHTAVTFAVLLAVAGLAVLIYFVHHIAVSIRIETLLAGLTQDAEAAVDRLYPEERPLGEGEQAEERELPDALVAPLAAPTSGYVQHVNVEALLRLAREADLTVRVTATPGRFVHKAETVLEICPADRMPDDFGVRALGTVVLGRLRTPEHDLEFSLRRIVELAQRALSPGVNDPTTALYCVDRLGQILVRLAGRAHPGALRRDAEGRPRVELRLETLEELACPAFAAVARYGLPDADVSARLAEVIARVHAASAPLPARRLQALAEEIHAAGLAQATLETDRQALQATG
jgi:uncharacterized membrane protein